MCKERNIKERRVVAIKKKYKYLVSYLFTHEFMLEDKKYIESGTGRIIVNVDFKIKTESDLTSVESEIIKLLEKDVDNITSVSLMSFNEVK